MQQGAVCRRHVRVLVATLAPLLIVGVARADMVALNPDLDNSIYQESSNSK